MSHHTITIKRGMNTDSTTTLQVFKFQTGQIPPVPATGDVVIWDDNLPGSTVLLVEYAYLRGTGPGILNKRRFYAHITLWVR